MTISSRVASIAACVKSIDTPELNEAWESALSLSKDFQLYVESLDPAKQSTFTSKLGRGEPLTAQEQLVLVNFTKARGQAWLSFSAELLYAMFPDFDAEVDAIVKA